MSDPLLAALAEMDAAIKSPARGGSLSAPDAGLLAMQRLNDALPALVRLIECADALRIPQQCDGSGTQTIVHFDEVGNETGVEHVQCECCACMGHAYDAARAALLAAITGGSK